MARPLTVHRCSGKGRGDPSRLHGYRATPAQRPRPSDRFSRGRAAVSPIGHVRGRRATLSGRSEGSRRSSVTRLDRIWTVSARNP
jgi:hypothetical protein